MDYKSRLNEGEGKKNVTPETRRRIIHGLAHIRDFLDG